MHKKPLATNWYRSDYKDDALFAYALLTWRHADRPEPQDLEHIVENLQRQYSEDFGRGFVTLDATDLKSLQLRFNLEPWFRDAVVSRGRSSFQIPRSIEIRWGRLIPDLVVMHTDQVILRKFMERQIPELINRYRNELFTGLLKLVGKAPTDWFRITVDLQSNIISMTVKTGVILVTAAGVYALQRASKNQEEGSSSIREDNREASLEGKSQEAHGATHTRTEKTSADELTYSFSAFKSDEDTSDYRSEHNIDIYVPKNWDRSWRPIFFRMTSDGWQWSIDLSSWMKTSEYVVRAGLYRGFRPSEAQEDIIVNIEFDSTLWSELIEGPISVFVHEGNIEGVEIYPPLVFRFEDSSKNNCWKWSQDGINWMPTNRLTSTVAGGKYRRKPSEEQQRLIQELERRVPTIEANRFGIAGSSRPIHHSSTPFEGPIGPSPHSAKPMEMSGNDHTWIVAEDSNGSRRLSSSGATATRVWRSAQAIVIAMCVLVLALNQRDITILLGLASTGTIVLCLLFLRPRKLSLPERFLPFGIALSGSLMVLQKDSESSIFGLMIYAAITLHLLPVVVTTETRWSIFTWVLLLALPITLHIGGGSHLTEPEHIIYMILSGLIAIVCLVKLLGNIGK